jgi:hypothetical protein
LATILVDELRDDSSHDDDHEGPTHFVFAGFMIVVVESAANRRLGCIA